MASKLPKNYLAEFVTEFFVILAVFVALASSFVIVINTLNTNQSRTDLPVEQRFDAN
ncbi:MAG: hypothetical protein WEC83_00625 [Patescibacteria group bacterium]